MCVSVLVPCLLPASYCHNIPRAKIQLLLFLGLVLSLCSTYEYKQL